MKQLIIQAYKNKTIEYREEWAHTFIYESGSKQVYRVSKSRRVCKTAGTESLGFARQPLS